MYYITEVIGDKVLIETQTSNEGYFTLEELDLLRDIEIDSVRYTKQGIKVALCSGNQVGDLYVLGVYLDTVRLRNILNGHESHMRMSDVEDLVKNGRTIQGVEKLANGLTHIGKVQPKVTNTVTARASLQGYKGIKLTSNGYLISYRIQKGETFVPGNVTSVLLSDSVQTDGVCGIILDDRVKKCYANWLQTKAGGKVVIDTTAVNNPDIITNVLNLTIKKSSLVYASDENRYKMYTVARNFLNVGSQEKLDTDTDTMLLTYYKSNLKSELKAIVSLNPAEAYVPLSDMAEYFVKTYKNWGKEDFKYELVSLLQSKIAKIYKKHFVSLGYVMLGGSLREVREAWYKFFKRVGGT